MKVPSASDKGTLRLGSRTSPAVNVMLFQASAEKSEPTCDTHSATNNPKPVAAESPATMGVSPCAVHASEKCARTASECQPIVNPNPITPSSAPIFAQVKTFWMPLP